MNEYGRNWFKERLNKIRSLSGYTAGESVKHAARRSRVKPSEILKLNANENLFMPKEKLAMYLNEVVEEVDPRFYPQEEEIELKEALGKYLGVSPKCIMIGCGSDPLIAFITQLLLESDEDVLSIDPTFSLYQLLVALRGANYFGIPLKDDFTMDVRRILTSVTSKARMFFLCSPNNPTANQFEIGKTQTLIKEFPGFVVIDEAYGEFANYSAVHLLEKFENLILIKTFSKAFGLAGLRLGYMVSDPELVETLTKKAQLPYPASSIALRMGLRLLTNIEIVNRAVNRLKRERERLIKKLNEINGVKAFNSQANFVLFQTNKESDKVFRALLNHGFLVRNLGIVSRLESCLRVTVGLPEMNDKLLAALEQVCG